MYRIMYDIHVREMKEGRKKEASKVQQGKATQHTQCTCTMSCMGRGCTVCAYMWHDLFA